MKCRRCWAFPTRPTSRGYSAAGSGFRPRHFANNSRPKRPRIKRGIVLGWPLAQRAETAGARNALILMAADRKARLHAGLLDAIGGGAVQRAGQGAKDENFQVLSGFDGHGTDL